MPAQSRFSLEDNIEDEVFSFQFRLLLVDICGRRIEDKFVSLEIHGKKLFLQCQELFSLSELDRTFYIDKCKFIEANGNNGGGTLQSDGLKVVFRREDDFHVLHQTILNVKTKRAELSSKGKNKRALTISGKHESSLSSSKHQSPPRPSLPKRLSSPIKSVELKREDRMKPSPAYQSPISSQKARRLSSDQSPSRLPLSSVLAPNHHRDFSPQALKKNFDSISKETHTLEEIHHVLTPDKSVRRSLEEDEILIDETSESLAKETKGITEEKKVTRSYFILSGPLIMFLLHTLSF
jgi:hypothetical protein